MRLSLILRDELSIKDIWKVDTKQRIGRAFGWKKNGCQTSGTMGGDGQ